MRECANLCAGLRMIESARISEAPVIRIVPRVEREERINVGILLLLHASRTARQPRCRGCSRPSWPRELSSPWTKSPVAENGRGRAIYGLPSQITASPLER